MIKRNVTGVTYEDEDGGKLSIGTIGSPDAEEYIRIDMEGVLDIDISDAKEFAESLANDIMRFKALILDKNDTEDNEDEMRKKPSKKKK